MESRFHPAETLRPVTPGDIPFLLEVYASTRAAELSLTDWSDEQKSAFCRSQFEAQDTHYRKHYPTAEYHIVEVGGVRAGRMYVDRWFREIRIMDIALLPAHRGKGTGNRLLLRLVEEATLSQRCLSIHVERYNPALRLYERLGFALKEDKGVYLLMEWNPS